jgi:hypothetical protein
MNGWHGMLPTYTACMRNDQFEVPITATDALLLRVRFQQFYSRSMTDHTSHRRNQIPSPSRLTPLPFTITIKTHAAQCESSHRSRHGSAQPR